MLDLSAARRLLPTIKANDNLRFLPDATHDCYYPGKERSDWKTGYYAVQLVRTAFIGWGAINSRVWELLSRRSARIEIVGIATLDEPKARADIPAAVPFLEKPDRLKEIKPDLVVEAAGREAIKLWAPAILQHARTLIIASTSAFCDDALLLRLQELAEKFGSRILIPSGAIGAIDALASAAVLRLDEVVHEIVKPPLAWKGTLAEKSFDPLNLTERRVFFSGSAREAAQRYPQNANATVVTSLAGIGLDRTRVELVADPSAFTNGHRITARGEFGKLTITLENNPLPTNPKSSELTALSLVHLVEQQGASVLI